MHSLHWFKPSYCTPPHHEGVTGRVLAPSPSPAHVDLFSRSGGIFKFQPKLWGLGTL